MENSISIKFNRVTKRFVIKHEKRNTVYEYLTSIFSAKNSEILTVLDDVSFSIKKGETIGIIGLNGSGKTTLLRLIAQILSPNSGTIETRGKITPFLELGTGFNGDLTARDNIIIYGTILGFTKKEIFKKIKKIIQFAELEKFLDTKLKNFSAGMNARLAFSTAIEVDPDILLVDEVLSVGDLPFQQKSYNAFMDFKNKGKTILLVSHDLPTISKICEKVLWLHKGKIMEFGEPLKVIEKYNQFVKE